MGIGGLYHGQIIKVSKASQGDKLEIAEIQVKLLHKVRQTVKMLIDLV